MFSDVCLSCGKELDDDRAYCNSQCQSGDLTSPSLSETSSPFSSPHLQYANGQDVPALVPSALGRALRAYTAASASSSSASSTAWSVLTDDDDSEFDDSHYDGVHLRPNALSYARRPSGTNNPLPRLHCRTGSGSSSNLFCSFPQSAPSFDRARFLPDDDTDCDLSDFASELASVSADGLQSSTITVAASPSKTSSRRKQNRASLPTYFSMLRVDSTNPAALPPAYPNPRVSPVSCSSGHSTLTGPNMRPSPPTPKLSVIAGLASVVASSPHHVHQTPRGRRRESASSPRRLRSASPVSRSPSPARRRDSDEKVADWSSGLARGRATRRNSSPPAKMLSASPRAIRSDSRGPSAHARARTRGRARVEELEGPGSAEHPGFGCGRSGLMSRAKRGGAGEEWAGLR
ncbi:hypothetical protein B0H13DRAFT_2648011 [Mycena leptocephala]|nr:hypothetical protein B0H13DRAFT_2648011 [Mycena leptocephala]